MTKRAMNVFTAKSNFANGLMALLIISLIVLGCTCNDKDGFDLGSKDNDSNSSEKKDGDTKATPEAKDDADFKADEDEVPSDAQAQALVKKTLMGFNEAVQAGDFADFHKTVSGTWRRTSKPADFNKGFKEFIDKEIDISRIRKEDAKFSPDPKIIKKFGKQVLTLKGTYEPSLGELPVNFNLEYIVDGDEWKLIFIGVDTTS